jgi:hypothetical protein
MTARLSHPQIQSTGLPVHFSYDGKPLQGLAGETLAAALAANGITALRHTRDGERRGLYCGMGACHECLVTVDGRASQRACMTKLEAGQTVLSAMPTGTPEAPLRPLTPPPGDAPATVAVDVLVIGAGPAGLSAALAPKAADSSTNHSRLRMRRPSHRTNNSPAAWLWSRPHRPLVW